jgi:lambda repressor-like predicted transcriptional regulator
VSDTLRHALARARIGTVDVAAALEVDPKTVDRWLKGRVPYPRHRWALADMLQLDESDLWPDVAQPRRTISREVKAVYPQPEVPPVARTPVVWSLDGV